MREKLSKHRSFLLHFSRLLLIALAVVILLIGCFYYVMLQALQTEVKSIRETENREIVARMEEALMQSRQIAIECSWSQYVQLFFTTSAPDDLVKDYMQKLSSLLDSNKRGYIDSIVLYTEEYDKVYDGKDGELYSVAEEKDTIYQAAKDTSWLGAYQSLGKKTELLFTRERADTWPYYLTYLYKWEGGEKSGIIMVNMDLEKLYDYLYVGDNELLECYMVDSSGRIFMRKNMAQLYTDMKEEVWSDSFQKRASCSDFQYHGGSAYVYTQNYLKTYDIDCVTFTPVGNYFTQLIRLRSNLIKGVVAVMVLVGVLVFVLSMKIAEPRKENQMLKQELTERQNMLHNVHLLALQTQINPHFIFNTLNIASLMLESEQEEHPVSNIINGLSTILRYALSKSAMVSVQDEIECAKQYLFLMQYRYGEFDSEIVVNESVKKCPMPKLILQPLIENAFQHGLSSILGNRSGMVKIRVSEMLYTYRNRRCVNSICIDVIDNGIGIEKEKLEEIRRAMAECQNVFREHIGLYNVTSRFRLLFHEEQDVTIESKFGQGTHIKIVFPIQEDERRKGMEGGEADVV